MSNVCHAMRILLPLFALASLIGADTYEAGDQRPMLGVEMSPVPINLQNEQGLSGDQGVLVRAVFPGTAAASAGVQAGDVITSINGTPISSMTDLRNIVSSHGVGDAVDLVVRRNGADVPMSSSFEPWPANIPFDRIDADAERRFREWQQRRQARQRDAIGALKDELAGLRQDLAKGDQAAPFTQAPALRQAKALLGLLPAWTFAYEYDTSDIQPAPGEWVETPAAGPAGKPAWQAIVVTSSRYRIL